MTPGRINLPQYNISTDLNALLFPYNKTIVSDKHLY